MARTLSLFPRLTNVQKGKVAEILAAFYLRLKGYKVLRQRGLHLAQTDLLLQKGKTIVLLEVKYRTTLTAARLALGPAQQQRLMRQARLVSKRFPHATIRLDVLALASVWPFLRHQIGVAPSSQA